MIDLEKLAAARDHMLQFAEASLADMPEVLAVVKADLHAAYERKVIGQGVGMPPLDGERVISPRAILCGPTISNEFRALLVADLLRTVAQHRVPDESDGRAIAQAVQAAFGETEAISDRTPQ